MAAEAEAAARVEETKRQAAEYEAMGGGAGTEALGRRPNPATRCAIDSMHTTCSASRIAARLLARNCRRPARWLPLRRRRPMPRWLPRQRRPLLRKPPLHTRPPPNHCPG